MNINKYFPRGNVRIPCNNNEEQIALNWQEIDWICSSDKTHWVWGQNIASIVKEKRGWKSGDLKNGWKSIEINRNTIIDFSDLFEPITDEFEGCTISWKYETYVLRESRHLFKSHEKKT